MVWGGDFLNGPEPITSRRNPLVKRLRQLHDARGRREEGLILRVIGESAAQPGTTFGSLLVVSALLQWLAGLAFLLNTWPRAKEK